MIDIWFEMICLHDVLPIDFSVNRLVSSLVSILNYIKCHRRFHINHSYAQYSPINYSTVQCNRQNNGCPLATQARWSSVYNNRRLLCSLFVSQCIVAVNKKVGLQSWCSHKLTVKAQTHQTKLNYQTVSKGLVHFRWPTHFTCPRPNESHCLHQHCCPRSDLFPPCLPLTSKWDELFTVWDTFTQESTC